MTKCVTEANDGGHPVHHQDIMAVGVHYIVCVHGQEVEEMNAFVSFTFSFLFN